MKMKKKIRIASVANNYGKSHDGVGAYAGVQGKYLSEFADVKVYTAECNYEDSFLRKFLCLGMTKQLFKVISDIKKRKIDVVLVDYLFVEWNPLILIPIAIIKKLRKKTGCKLVISLHEYNRVRPIRKKVITKLCKDANLILVADEHMKKSIRKINDKVEIRPIPSNVYDKNILSQKIDKEKNEYVYFGLVNKAKAFNEMLEAWDIFNENGNNRLTIISSSTVNGLDNHKCVEYKHNMSDNDILRVMMKCAVCVVPVIPEVDMKNTTFKTGCMTGCICLGKFCGEFAEKSFTVDMNEYTVNEFVKSFRKIDSISDEVMISLNQDAREFGKQFTPPDVMRRVYKYISEIDRTKRDNNANRN